MFRSCRFDSTWKTACLCVCVYVYVADGSKCKKTSEIDDDTSIILNSLYSGTDTLTSSIYSTSLSELSEDDPVPPEKEESVCACSRE